MKLWKRLISLAVAVMMVITMVVPTYAAGSVKLNKSSATLYAGESLQLKVTGTKSKVTWSSSNKSVAKVSSKGKVTAVKAGKATIKAKVGKKTYSCAITVKNVSLNKTSVTLLKGKTTTLKLNGGKIKSVKSSNTAIATVAKSGKVTAKKAGKATITVTSTKGKKYTCKVTVNEAKVYTIWFEPDSGIESHFSLRVKGGEKIPEPSIINRNGYAFGGWYTSRTYETRFDFEKTVASKNMTLYAGWIDLDEDDDEEDDEDEDYENETCIVSFYSDGGTAVSPIEVAWGETVSAPEAPTREGYVFTGWYTSSALEELFLFDSDYVWEDITLYAGWVEETPSVETYTVTFESNGGSAVAAVSVTKGETVSAPEPPTREGYVFTGWYTSSALEELFLFDSDIITGDMTLYAGWIEDNPDKFAVESAIAQVVVGYQTGDNAVSVTRDVILATSVEGVEGVAIRWNSSKSSIISTNGSVNRPSGENTSVTLTATASKGSESATKEFVVTVAHENTRNDSELPNQTVVDIENMNNGDGEGASVSYNEEGNQVSSIEGQYSTIIVETVDDALDTIQSNHTILGIDNAEEELDIYNVSKDEYGTQYTFTQSYNDIEVYGYSVTASVGENGVTDFLNADLVPTEVLSGVNTTPAISAAEAERIAVEYCGENCTAISENTKLIIYALGEYQVTPVLAYEIFVKPTPSDETNACERVYYIHARNGECVASTVCEQYTNTISSDIMTSAKDELGNTLNFPVVLEFNTAYPSATLNYIMRDSHRNITMYTSGFASRLSSWDNSWKKREVSAYTNLAKVYDWYNSTLNRNSIDGNGMQVKGAMSYNVLKSPQAQWSSSDGGITFFVNLMGNDNMFSNSMAACLDIVGHEYTHGVMAYTACKGYGYYAGYYPAINEGYADLMGCLIDDNWILGDPNQEIRNVQKPENSRCPDKLSSKYYINPTEPDKKDSYYDKAGHNDSTLISHAGYLMFQKGISKKILAQLWYKSMSMGYTASSSFYTVRRNVLQAAQQMGLSATQIKYIKEAFNDEEIYGDRGNLVLKIATSNQNDIPLSVNFSIDSLSGENQDIDIDGLAFITGNQADADYNLDVGTYTVTVSAEGYLDFVSNVTITRDETTTLNVTLLREGTGTLSGQIVSATTGYALNGVRLNIRSGWNVTSGDIIATTTTGNDGRYSTDLNTGHYTVEMVLEGYTNGSMNVTVEAGGTNNCNGTLSPIMTSDTYRVVLTWGYSPSDLDSHLAGTSGDGTSFHIYYSDRYAYNSSGEEIGNLDVDDTSSYGPETVTFKVDTTGSYYYYVHRYSSGSLPASSANVKVYNGTTLIGDFNIDSSQSSDLKYWNVFSIRNGIFKKVDRVSDEVITSGITGLSLMEVKDKAEKAVEDDKSQDSHNSVKSEAETEETQTNNEETESEADATAEVEESEEGDEWVSLEEEIEPEEVLADAS